MERERSSKTFIKMAAFNRIPPKEQEKARIEEEERTRRKKEEERTRRKKEERILETFLKVSNPAYSKFEWRKYCIELFEMGVQPPEWCFSPDALGDAYDPTIIKPAGPIGAPEGGRLRRRRQTRRKPVKRRTRRRSKK